MSKNLQMAEVHLASISPDRVPSGRDSSDAVPVFLRTANNREAERRPQLWPFLPSTLLYECGWGPPSPRVVIAERL